MGRLNRSSVPFKGATCSRNCHGNLIRLSDVVLPLGVRVCVLGFSFPGKLLARWDSCVGQQMEMHKSNC